MKFAIAIRLSMGVLLLFIPLIFGYQWVSFITVPFLGIFFTYFYLVEKSALWRGILHKDTLLNTLKKLTLVYFTQIVVVGLFYFIGRGVGSFFGVEAAASINWMSAEFIAAYSIIVLCFVADWIIRYFFGTAKEMMFRLFSEKTNYKNAPRSPEKPYSNSYSMDHTQQDEHSQYIRRLDEAFIEEIKFDKNHGGSMTFGGYKFNEPTACLTINETATIIINGAIVSGQLTDVYNYTSSDSSSNVQMTISGLQQVCASQYPRGQWIIERGYSPCSNVTIEFNEIYYGRNFSGSITLAEGWVHVVGEFSIEEHKSTSIIAVEVHCPLDMTEVNWSKYTFTHPDELRHAPIEQVRSISFMSPEIHTIAEHIDILQKCTYIKHAVFIGEHHIETNRLDDVLMVLPALENLLISIIRLETLPSEVISNPSFKSLSLYSTSTKHIPDELWQHPGIEHIRIAYTNLSQVPKLNLPELKTLDLQYNNLDSLPAEVFAPKLHTLCIKGNKLNLMPDWIMKLPVLKNIMLSDNNWTHFPEGFLEKFPNCDFSYKDKVLLGHAYTYKGADNQGLIKWDESIFHPVATSPLWQPIDTIFSENKTMFSDTFISQIKNAMTHAVSFERTVEDDYSTLGKHRFGGLPDLPIATEYPTFNDKKYEFIGQINCDEIASLQAYLPRTGMLYFFIKSQEHFGQAHDSVKVVYEAVSEEKLISGQQLTFKSDDYYDLYKLPQPYRMSAKVSIGIPYIYGGDNSHLLDASEVAKVRDNFDDVIHKARPKQDCGINSFSFTQSDSPQVVMANAIGSDPRDCIVLLCVESFGDFNFWDAGTIYFIIHKSDLLKQDFSNVFGHLESS